MNNKYWGKINDLLRHGFVFKGIVELDIDEDPICTSAMVNGKKYQGLVEIYKSVRYNYEAEISIIEKDLKAPALKEIISRNQRLKRIISDAEHQLAVEEAIPVHRRSIPAMQGNQVIAIEKKDPPCQDIKISLLKNYISFAKDILNINELKLVNLGDRLNRRTGFLSWAKEGILKEQHSQLQREEIINCEFEVFKNVFLGKASAKIDWTESFAALAYFINRIPEEGRLAKEKWIMTVKCFTYNGQEIKPEQLRHAQTLTRLDIKKSLDDVVSGLFPMSHA